jgi:hypothetical protein
MGGGVAVRSTEDGLSKELDRSTKTGVCIFPLSREKVNKLQL